MITEYYVSCGCGDYPTNELSSETSYKNVRTKEDEKREEEMKAKGYIKDSTGRWYDPKNYIDSYYADW